MAARGAEHGRACFMHGLRPVQSHTAPCSEGSWAWGLTLCSHCPEILNHFV